MIIYSHAQHVDRMFNAARFKIQYDTNPCIIVIRNLKIMADNIWTYLEDDGTNNCDTIILRYKNDFIPLTGRSYPHDRYQRRMVNRTSKANYIASSYTPNAYRKGYHKGNEALRQNVKFMLYRSDDMILDEDGDYNEYNIVADNFHGQAPYSAGCITVEGDMDKNPAKNTGDWRQAHNWIYSLNHTLFDCAIFQYVDIALSPSLRLGSTGKDVRDLQKELKIKVDGDFGPITHQKLREYQEYYNIRSDGICDKSTAEHIGIILS